MKINDFLYGEYEFPDWIVPLIHTPAIQRLRWVALSNVPSLSYPMVSGVSRYAHSLGVCILAAKISKQLCLSEKAARELQCSALLHDAGMPPLGHLTEEALSDIGVEFDHELSLNSILMGQGRRFEVMPDGKKIGVTEAFQKAGVEAVHVFENIKGTGVNGSLLASKVDLDNIDNIVRLHKLIFGLEGGYDPACIAYDYFGAKRDARESALDQWKKTRIELYTKLMFSVPDLAQKATIKRLMKSYFSHEFASRDKELVIDEVRFLNDSQFMIKVLDVARCLKNPVSYHSGDMDRVVSYGWVDSVEKDKLKLVKVALGETTPDYYVDYIPDKRFKYTDGHAQPKDGALVALFSTEKKDGVKDRALIQLLTDQLPNWRMGFLPSADQEENFQLGLV